jgi:hypothetical protein
LHRRVAQPFHIGVTLCRIDGVGSEYADLLEAAGVDTVVELAPRNPANLTEQLGQANA